MSQPAESVDKWREARKGDEGKMCRAHLSSGVVMETGKGWYDIVLIGFMPQTLQPVVVHLPSPEPFIVELAEVQDDKPINQSEGPACPYCATVSTDWDDPSLYTEGYNSLFVCCSCKKSFIGEVSIYHLWSATKVD